VANYDSGDISIVGIRSIEPETSITPTPTPSITPTISQTPTSTHSPYTTIVVYDPKNDFLDTSIDVTANVTVLNITASGLINIGWPTYPNDNDPNGKSEAPLDAYTGLTIAALIGRIGVDGPFFKIGSAFSSVVNRSGRLYIGIYDPLRGDNSGSFNVDITAYNAVPLTPTPTPTQTPANVSCFTNGWTSASYGSTSSISGISSGALWNRVYTITNPYRIIKGSGTTDNGIDFIIGETIFIDTPGVPSHLNKTGFYKIADTGLYDNYLTYTLACLDIVPSTTPTRTPTQTPTNTLTPTPTNTPNPALNSTAFTVCEVSDSFSSTSNTRQLNLCWNINHIDPLLYPWIEIDVNYGNGWVGFNDINRTSFPNLSCVTAILQAGSGTQQYRLRLSNSPLVSIPPTKLTNWVYSTELNKFPSGDGSSITNNPICST
jgi:hypothetical protein